ncbi:FMNH(2)-dependent alkanesulfonate monooxygenase (SsuD-like) [Mycolicibacterium chitae]|uniref:F420-dependent methylene-tetrahydromethanopterin reductase n=2 Tax=Mycobacteriaceae TaxID=1762 RepID=A0A3S4RTD4_MYCCI|nr:FMNH(2)-dependent alkanesulfonate monooxygenase (SsuD-like) [Mycolicibacterium chitae]VEG48400.1 F420-dependent methylene-tetrahydromethanopterin reductase [Mycolicibacterium chitae]
MDGQSCNGLRIMWYINGADGDVPWQRERRVPPSLSHLRTLAAALDQLGYFGALSTARETIALVGDTERLRFMIPEYPGVKPPALLAEEAQVFDHYSGGRLIYNQVNGADPVLARYGRFESKAQRYAVSEEYWPLVRQLYLDDTSAVDGEYFQLGPRYKPAIAGPRQRGGVPVWGTGASPEGIAHAAEVLDVYLSFLAEPALLAGTFGAMRTAAAAKGRSIPAGVLASVIVRDTDDAAWSHFEWQLSHTDPAEMARLADRNLRSFGFGPLSEMTSADPQVQDRIDALRAGRIPSREALEFAPGLAAGLTTWTSGEPPFDIAGKGSGNYLVGSPETVAKQITELSAELDIDTWILSGWPLAAEAERFAQQVMPLLDIRPYEPPQLVSASTG